MPGFSCLGCSNARQAPTHRRESQFRGREQRAGTRPCPWAVWLASQGHGWAGAECQRTSRGQRQRSKEAHRQSADGDRFHGTAATLGALGEPHESKRHQNGATTCPRSAQPRREPGSFARIANVPSPRRTEPSSNQNETPSAVHAPGEVTNSTTAPRSVTVAATAKRMSEPRIRRGSHECGNGGHISGSPRDSSGFPAPRTTDGRPSWTTWPSRKAMQRATEAA